MRGRGRSDYDPVALNYVPQVYAGGVLALLDPLGISRAIFVGTSMGGIITMAAAAKRLGAIAAAVLNDVGPAVAPEGLQRILGYVVKSPHITSWAEAVDYVKAIAGPAYPAFSEEDWRDFAETTFRQLSDDNFELDYDPAIMEPIRRGKIKAPGWLAWFLFRRLARRRPTLLVRGAISEIVSPGIAERMKRTAPQLQTVEVPRTGHAPMLTEPAARSAISAFLAGIE